MKIILDFYGEERKKGLLSSWFLTTSDWLAIFRQSVDFWRNSYAEAKSLLSVRNVEKSYEILGGGENYVLRKVSLGKTGAMVGLLGEAAQAKRPSPG